MKIVISIYIFLGDFENSDDFISIYMNEVVLKPDKVVVGGRWCIYPIYRSDNGLQSTPGCLLARLGCIPVDWAAADTILQ